jgi:hypothetical protein
MTLVVDYKDFFAAVKRHGIGDDSDCVYYKRVGDSINLTYVNPQTGVQVVSFSPEGEGEVTAALEAQGLCGSKGTWVTEASLEHLTQLASETYIAAVAYDTKKGPGLWIDALPTPPSEGAVLRAIFDEFVSEGLLDERAFEQFVHEAKPTVRILDPSDIERLLKQKPAQELIERIPSADV